MLFVVMFLSAITMGADGNQKPKFAEFGFAENVIMKFEYLDIDDGYKTATHYKDCGVVAFHYPGTWGEVVRCDIREDDGKGERQPTMLCVQFKTARIVTYREWPIDIFDDPNPKTEKTIRLYFKNKIRGVNLIPIEKR